MRQRHKESDRKESFALFHPIAALLKSQNETMHANQRPRTKQVFLPYVLH